MDSDSSRRTTYIPNIRGIRIIYEGGEISIVESDYVADHSDVDDSGGLLDRVVAGGNEYQVPVDAPESHPVHIPTVGSISPELWGVRVGYLLTFIAGIIFSWVAQLIIAVLATGL